MRHPALTWSGIVVFGTAAADWIGRAAGLYADFPGLWGGIADLAKAVVTHMTIEAVVMAAGIGLFVWGIYGDKIKARFGNRATAKGRGLLAVPTDGTNGNAVAADMTAATALVTHETTAELAPRLAQLAEHLAQRDQAVATLQQSIAGQIGRIEDEIAALRQHRSALDDQMGRHQARLDRVLEALTAPEKIARLEELERRLPEPLKPSLGPYTQSAMMTQAREVGRVTQDLFRLGYVDEIQNILGDCHRQIKENPLGSIVKQGETFTSDEEKEAWRIGNARVERLRTWFAAEKRHLHERASLLRNPGPPPGR